jgi:virulence factor Mce-like protein
MTRRPTASIIASAVLVGAVTVLVTIVAVFLAYNANSGLPFVPTYDVKAQLPSGANLVVGNEVRVGGFRVGLVEEIEPATVVEDGQRKTVAVVSMKLDKIVEPLPADSQVSVRPRSVLGLKYIELVPGESTRTLPAGATIALERGDQPPVEFDDVFSTFDADTRDNARFATEGFGDAFAGRGQSLNRTLEAFNPLFTHLTPVMRVLSDPDTELDEFFRQIGRASAQVAPIARVQAELFTNMADTFEAFSRNPRALQATIEKAPDALQAGIESFPVQRPFLTDFADLSRRLRPAVQELPRSVPAIVDAFEVGQPVLRRSVSLNEQTEEVFETLDNLAAQPTTQLALDEIKDLTTVTTPLLDYVTPYQTVCNYTNYFFYGLGNVFAKGVAGGTAFNSLLNSTNRTQDNRPSDFPADRPADVPVEQDSQVVTDPTGEPLTKNLTQPYPPAIDAQGNADCQAGQWGYIEQWGDGRYGPTEDGGGSVVMNPNTPGNAGPTFTGSANLGAVEADIHEPERKP